MGRVQLTCSLLHQHRVPAEPARDDQHERPELDGGKVAFLGRLRAVASLWPGGPGEGSGGGKLA